MLDRMQALLDRVNDNAGGIGSVLAVLFWMVILALAIWHMLKQA
jgi:hypothetical protein